ncbi:hypothetical protein LCGC14_3018320 [marine sediment metagenome]|uniref:Uncharacterized protein n=1 Tax=marine sediment metagenome TaxID=412755 RepID=A0A0F8Z3Q0_9ZZZZ
MPKVTLHFGITIPGQKEYSSVRADVGFEIDADGDIDAQLKQCLTAVKATEEPLEGALVQQVANLEGVSLEGAGIATDFAAFVKRMENRVDSIIGEVKRHKDVLEALDAAGLVKASKAAKPKAKDKAKDKAEAEVKVEAETEEEPATAESAED